MNIQLHLVNECLITAEFFPTKLYPLFVTLADWRNHYCQYVINDGYSSQFPIYLHVVVICTSIKYVRMYVKVVCIYDI